MSSLPKLDFTDARVLKAEPGEYQDTQTRALRLYVSNTGTRSWAVYKWSAKMGKPIKKVIGRIPEMTVAMARAEATALLRQIAEGKDLDKPNKELSMRELMKLYTADLRERRTKNPVWLEYHIETKFKSWLPKPLSHLTVGQIKTRAAQIDVDSGPQAAAVAVRALRTLYAFAKLHKYYTGDNEAQQVEVARCEPRQRVMTADEKEKIMAVLRSDKVPDWCHNYFRLLMLTGVRRSNLISAQWDHIDLDAALWVIPAENAKAGKTLEVALNDEAVAILRSRIGVNDKWVFPSSRDGGKRHLFDPHNAWLRILELAGVKGLTIHDLRRTYGGVLINAGVPMPHVAKALGHSDPATTARHYAHVTVSTVAEHLKRVAL